jgi:hypothetical protein
VTYDPSTFLKKSFFKHAVHWEDWADWTSDGELLIERDLFGLVCAIRNLKTRSHGSSWRHEY